MEPLSRPFQRLRLRTRSDPSRPSIGFEMIETEALGRSNEDADEEQNAESATNQRTRASSFFSIRLPSFFSSPQDEPVPTSSSRLNTFFRLRGRNQGHHEGNLNGDLDELDEDLEHDESSTAVGSAEWLRYKRRMATQFPSLVSIIVDFLRKNQHLADPDLVPGNLYDAVFPSRYVYNGSNLFLREIVSIASYRKFCFRGCRTLGDTGVEYLTTKHSRIEELDFTLCTRLTSQGLKSIAIHARQHLVSLTLAHAEGVSMSGICKVLESCLQLKELNLSQCRCLTDALVFAIAAAPCARQLTVLRLGGAYSITDVSLLTIATEMPQLEVLDLWGANLTCESIPSISLLSLLCELNLSHIPVITDDAMVKALENKEKLTQISLRDCCLLTNRIVYVLAANSPGIRSVDFVSCPKIMSDAFYHLAKHAHSLRNYSSDTFNIVGITPEHVQLLLSRHNH